MPTPLTPAGGVGVSTPITVTPGGLVVAQADGDVALIGALMAEVLDSLGAVVVASAAIAVAKIADLDASTARFEARFVGPLTVGDYVITWMGPAGQRASEPLLVRVGITPTVSEVAALLRARTKVPGGGEAGTFTGATRPTQAEVEELLEDAADEVLGKVQAPSPGTDYERRVRGAIRLYAAMLVELSYFPEQVGSDRSPYASYAALYKSRIDALIAEGETGEVQGTGEGSGGDGAADASWYFPADDGGLVGWGSNW